MTTQVFVTDLWYRDLEDLPPQQRELAVDLLLYSSFESQCRPYHRASKADSPSDRQTIFQHPKTGHAWFVISVVPAKDPFQGYALRVDFFDKKEVIDIPFTDVQRAPRTQWDEKGERRFIVTSSTLKADLREAVKRIVELK
jgi:hypothetical protein